MINTIYLPCNSGIYLLKLFYTKEALQWNTGYLTLTRESLLPMFLQVLLFSGFSLIPMILREQAKKYSYVLYLRRGRVYPNTLKESPIIIFNPQFHLEVV